VQIIASDALAGNDLPHPSQDGLSSSIAVTPVLKGREVRVRVACRQV
jgi:hypothetical protein